jgi:hypothetical protein
MRSIKDYTQDPAQVLTCQMNQHPPFHLAVAQEAPRQFSYGWVGASASMEALSFLYLYYRFPRLLTKIIRLSYKLQHIPALLAFEASFV